MGDPHTRDKLYSSNIEQVIVHQVSHRPKH